MITIKKYCTACQGCKYIIKPSNCKNSWPNSFDKDYFSCALYEKNWFQIELDETIYDYIIWGLAVQKELATGDCKYHTSIVANLGLPLWYTKIINQYFKWLF